MSRLTWTRWIWGVAIFYIACGLGHSAYGIFCMIMNMSPEEYFSGVRIIGLGDETRGFGSAAALLGGLMFWGGVFVIAKRRELAAIEPTPPGR